jgi:hypothetical protein
MMILFDDVGKAMSRYECWHGVQTSSLSNINFLDLKKSIDSFKIACTLCVHRVCI